MNEQQIEFTIKSDLSLVACVGRALSALLAGTALEPHRIATFELAVVEVVTNVIEHAYQNQTGHKVDLSVCLPSDSARVQVRDYGKQLDKEVVERYTSDHIEVQDPGDSIADLPVSGWGTSLVAKLCDEVRYEQVDDANVLTLICHIDCASDQILPNAS